MTYRGQVKNGLIVLEGTPQLAEGDEVLVEVRKPAAATESPTWGEVFKDIVGKAQGLPSDMAENHDHYLHGTPKR